MSISNERKEELLQKQFKQLKNMRELKDGWDGNESKSFDADFLNDIKAIIMAMRNNDVLEVFPLTDGSVQLELDDVDISLEIELSKFYCDKDVEYVMKYSLYDEEALCYFVSEEITEQNLSMVIYDIKRIIDGMAWIKLYVENHDVDYEDDDFDY